jgi:hypothetical protein
LSGGRRAKNKRQKKEAKVKKNGENIRFIFYSLVLANLALANGPLPLPRLSSPIKLDGVIDEPAWEAIAPFPLVMYQPT